MMKAEVIVRNTFQLERAEVKRLKLEKLILQHDYELVTLGLNLAHLIYKTVPSLFIEDIVTEP